MKTPKSFHTQFCECKKLKLNPPGKFVRFKDDPGLLPAPWHKPAIINVKKMLEENPNAGLQFLKCLKFGGNCDSGNKKCQKLRGLL